MFMFTVGASVWKQINPTTFEHNQSNDLLFERLAMIRGANTL